MAEACPLPIPEHLLQPQGRAGAPGGNAMRGALDAAADMARIFSHPAERLRELAEQLDINAIQMPHIGAVPPGVPDDELPIREMLDDVDEILDLEIPETLREAIPGLDSAPDLPPDVLETIRATLEADAPEFNRIKEELRLEDETMSRRMAPLPKSVRQGPERRWGPRPDDDGNLLIRTSYTIEKDRFFRGSRLMQLWKRIAYAVGETLQSGRPVLPWKDFRDLMLFNAIYRHTSVVTTMQIERQLDDLLARLSEIPEQYRSLSKIKQRAAEGHEAEQRFMEALASHIHDWEYTIARHRNPTEGLLSSRTVPPRWIDLLLSDQDVVIVRTPSGVSVQSVEARARALERAVVDPKALADPLDTMDGIRAVLEHLAAISRNAVMEYSGAKYLVDNRKPIRLKSVTVGGQEVLLPAEFADVVARHNSDTGLERWFNSTVPWQIDSALTAMSLTGDLSALFNQIGMLMVARPKQFGKLAMLAFAEAAGNREGMRRLQERAVRALAAEMKRRGITDDPEAVLISLGLARTGIAEDIAGHSLMYRLPVAGTFFKGFNIAFSDMLYAARLMLLEQAVRNPSVRDIDDRIAWLRAVHEYIQSVNDLTGTTNVRTTTAEKLVFLASRLVRSQIVTPVLALVPGRRGELARRLVFYQAVATAALTWAWNELNGESTEFNPLKPNFLTFRDVFGNDIRLVPWMSIIPAISRSIASGSPDPLANWALWKARPTLRTAINAIRQEDTSGMKHPGFDDPEIIRRILANYIPLTFRPLYEDRPGEQGYEAGPRIVETLASGLGLPASPLTISERLERERNRESQAMFGRPYDELDAKQRAAVNDQEEVKRLIRERKEANTRRADTYEAERAERSLEFDRRMEQIARWVEQGRDDRGRRYTKRDAREAINEAYAQLLTEQRSRDPVLDGWFNLRELARLGDGTIDYDLLEKLRAEYLAAHPGLASKLDQVEGQYDTPLLAEYREARELARAYYDIPAYQGMTSEQSAIASRTIALADAVVRSGQAQNRAHALDLLVYTANITAEERALAIMAGQRGSNPARKKFAKEHPLFAEWYLGAIELPTRSAIALGTTGGKSPKQKREDRRDILAKALRLRPVSGM